jgi:hypothetical protein
MGADVQDRITAESRYETLKTERDPFLRRAIECAKYTIPSIISENQDTAAEDLLTPWQSIGARGVSNLTSKQMLALFPPNESFFKFNVEEYVLQKLAEANNTQLEKIKSDFELGLNKMTEAIKSDMESSALRVDMNEALENLMITGNFLIFVPASGKIKGFQLNRYVCRRDAMGNPVEIVVKETFSPRSLSSELRSFLAIDVDKEEDVDVFTYLLREDTEWTVYQEAKQKIIPKSKGSYKLDSLPWLALRGIKRNGEDYGRSYVEKYLGDLKSLDALSQALVEGATAAARVIFLVNPNGTTNVRTLNNTRNLGFAPGNPEDVQAVQVEKAADFATAHNAIKDITDRLSYAFLLNTAVQRNGDRVTAEEIRYVAQELEDQQGGIYSILSQELQMPLVTIWIDRLTKAKKLPPLPKDAVKPTVVTGIQALGRGHDRAKLDQFLQGISATLGPEAVPKYVKVLEAIKRRAIADGINVDGLLYTEEELAQQAQQAAMQNLASQAAPEVIKGAVAGMQQKPQ